MKIKLNLPALTVFFLSLFMSSISCSDSKTPSPNPNPNMEIEGQNSPYISLDSSQLNTQEFQLAPITIQNINSYVHAVGTLAVPPENQEEVSVFFEGNLSEIYLLPGTQVNKGDVLFWVKGPAYIEIQEAFLESKESLEVAKKEFERIQTLYTEKLLSEKEFTAQRAAYKIENTRFQGLQKNLSLLNINTAELTAETIKSEVPIRAPQSGYVTSITKTKGAFLRPSDVVLTLTNTAELHLEIKIFEEDYAKVALNQNILFWLQSNAEEKHLGKVHLINKRLEEEDRTIEIHGDIEDKNIREKLAPGMYIECDIITETLAAPALPTEAIVTIDTKHYVLQKIAENQFKKTEVALGKRTSTYVEILNADEFEKNTQFITKGGFLLLAE